MSDIIAENGSFVKVANVFKLVDCGECYAKPYERIIR